MLAVGTSSRPSVDPHRTNFPDMVSLAGLPGGVDVRNSWRLYPAATCLWTYKVFIVLFSHGDLVAGVARIHDGTPELVLHIGSLTLPDPDFNCHDVSDAFAATFTRHAFYVDRVDGPLYPAPSNDWRKNRRLPQDQEQA